MSATRSGRLRVTDPRRDQRPHVLRRAEALFNFTDQIGLTLLNPLSVMIHFIAVEGLPLQGRGGEKQRCNGEAPR
jgi:hypothetical protein